MTRCTGEILRSCRRRGEPPTFEDRAQHLDLVEWRCVIRRRIGAKHGERREFAGRDAAEIILATPRMGGPDCYGTQSGVDADALLRAGYPARLGETINCEPSQAKRFSRCHG